jgi:hypothetical protein
MIGRKHPDLLLSSIRIILFLLGSTIIAWGADNKLEIDADFRFGTNSDIVRVDHLFLRSGLEFEFEVSKDFECLVEVTADLHELEMSELTFKWKREYLNILVGKFENALTLDEYLSSFDRIFANKSLVSRLIDTQGYTSNYIGVKVYKNEIQRSSSLSYLAHLLYVPSQLELQFDLGFILHFAGKNSYLGFLGSYFPFFVHHVGLDEENKYPLHNFFVDLFWANHRDRFVYGLELSGGSNLIDPIGLIHFPGSDTSIFLSADAYLGYRLGPKGKRWVPKFRYSILFPDASALEAQQMELLFGNEFRFGNKTKLHADVGLGINTFYDGGVLYTQLEILWAINFLVNL